MNLARFMRAFSCPWDTSGTVNH